MKQRKKLLWHARRITGRTSRLSTLLKPPPLPSSWFPLSLFAYNFIRAESYPFWKSKLIVQAPTSFRSKKFERTNYKVRERFSFSSSKFGSHSSAFVPDTVFSIGLSVARFHSFPPFTSTVTRKPLLVINGVDQIDLRRELDERKTRENWMGRPGGRGVCAERTKDVVELA